MMMVLPTMMTKAWHLSVILVGQTRSYLIEISKELCKFLKHLASSGSRGTIPRQWEASSMAQLAFDAASGGLVVGLSNHRVMKLERGVLQVQSSPCASQSSSRYSKIIVTVQKRNHNDWICNAFVKGRLKRNFYFFMRCTLEGFGFTELHWCCFWFQEG